MQLFLISKAAMLLLLEPANVEDLEADLEPYVPGRFQPSATVAGGHDLVVQIKMDNGEPWSIEEFDTLLNLAKRVYHWYFTCSAWCRRII